MCTGALALLFGSPAEPANAWMSLVSKLEDCLQSFTSYFHNSVGYRAVRPVELNSCAIACERPLLDWRLSLITPCLVMWQDAASTPDAAVVALGGEARPELA